MMLSPTSTRRLMFLVGSLLIVIFPFFFIGGPTFYSTPLFRKLWDCGHIVFFVSVVIAFYTKINISGWRPFIVISVTVFVLGGAIEVIQAHTGRDGNWQDLLNDVAATWLALFWLQKSNLWVWLGRLIAMALLMPPVTAVFFAAWSQLQAEKNFPVLADFESSIDLHGWKGDIERSNVFHSSGNYSLKAHLNTKKYSGLSLLEFYNSWQGYTTLSFDIYNPEPLPIDLVIRVSDVRHELGANVLTDRFNKKLHVESGWNPIEIPVAAIRQAPATRQLDMDSITSMIIFAMQLQKEQDIYLDNVRLQ